MEIIGVEVRDSSPFRARSAARRKVDRHSIDRKFRFRLAALERRRYDRCMTPLKTPTETHLRPPPRMKPLWRALIEVAFIVFLFYSNLLMGEFTGVNGQNKTFAFALRDVITPTNFIIAIVSAFIGYGIFEFLRKKL